MLIFLILAALLILQSAVSLREGYRFLRYARRSRERALADFAPAAAVLVPCKGLDADFDQNLEGYLAQDYPRYQLVFIVASDRDPAHRALAARLGELTARQAGEPARNPPPGPSRTALVVSEFSNERGEKVNNLLRGLAAVDPKAEVLVFADIDARPGREWLRSLVEPLGAPEVTVSTGFRWYLPGRGIVSQIRAAWDTSVAMHLGDHKHNFAWGGSMALRVEVFKRLRVAERYWARTVSDDYAITRAVREASGAIRFEPRCLIASREESSFREFFRWSTRQIILTRVYARRLWALGLASHALYCGTFLLGLALLAVGAHTTPAGRLAIAASLACVLVLGFAKARLRTVVARESFPEEAESLARLGGRYWQLAPLVPWIMFVNFIVAGFARRIDWRGTQYELRSAEEIVVLGRD